jgi:MYXO-CTERM domain-containing protein
MKRLRENKSPLVSNSRWLAYAAANAATSLSGAHSAEAEIHYSGVINDHVRSHELVPLDHSARLRFNQFNTYQCTFAIDGAAVSNAFCGYEGRFGTNYVSRLSQGVVISNCSFLAPRGSFLVLAPYSGGPFFAKGIGFIGFRFNNGAGMQYGWARLRMPGPRYFEMRFALVDYAWGDPGDQIRAGQTSLAGDQVEAGPDQGSLGLLALGGAGLMAWRRRRTGR